MKRTIKHPDGREETLEGTPDELARHELLRDPVVTVAPAPFQDVAPNPYPWPTPPDVKWEPHMGTGQQRCLYDGLPPGAYMLSCPYPKHSVHC